MKNNPKALQVEVQLAVESECAEAPEPEQIKAWASNAFFGTSLSSEILDSELCIRVVNRAEIQALNKQYRSKDKATNVLSFPAELDGPFDFHLLGDIVLCHDVIVSEAKEQGKTVDDHYAHMVTHGVLHLCGYDHLQDKQALIMESLEKELLAKVNVANPYC